MIERRIPTVTPIAAAHKQSMRWSWIHAHVVFLTIVLLVIPAMALSQTEGDARPKIGLVLSGGGARGVAHVGVIKVLDEMRIPVDYITGTSMGAIVGSLYASGMSAKEVEQTILNADWTMWLSDRPSRADRPYRRKADDFGFLVDFEVGVRHDGLILPRGIVQGQNFTMDLRRWLLPVATVDDFNRLPIPFRAVATNLVSGREVVLDSGDLPTAVRASMSLPAILKPVRLDGQILVDGGVANNLPVGIAKEMGAEVLIVVDAGYPLLQEEQLDSVLAVTSQMTTIMVHRRAEQEKQLMTTHDVLITPDLDLMSSQAFDQSSQAMRLGEEKARQVTAGLKQFSLSEDDYADYRQSVLMARSGIPVIHKVEIENESKLSTKVLRARLSEQRGAPLDVGRLEVDIADIYGFDTFETVDYSITTQGRENTLRIQSTAKSWGPNYLRFGINLEDDFDGNSHYNLAARLTKTEINAKGGEFRADVAIGENPQLAAEFYQPLDYNARWFINPRLSFQRASRGLFDGGNEIAEFRSKETELSVGVGRIFSNWGEVRLTLARGFSDDEVRIGDPTLGNASGQATSFTLGFGYDTIDRIAVPRFGTNVQLVWSGLRDGFGSDRTADVGVLSFLKPQTWGRNTLLHWWDFGSVSNARGASLGAFQLGGLFNLSGFAPDQLQGDHRAIGRILYYRRLGDSRMPVLDTAVYVGASIEAGNVWQSRSDVSFRNSFSAGSVFVVLDTVIGPLYLAYGTAEGGRNSAYLFLGQTF